MNIYEQNLTMEELNNTLKGYIESDVRYIKVKPHQMYKMAKKVYTREKLKEKIINTLYESDRKKF